MAVPSYLNFPIINGNNCIGIILASANTTFLQKSCMIVHEILHGLNIRHRGLFDNGPDFISINEILPYIKSDIYDITEIDNRQNIMWYQADDDSLNQELDIDLLQSNVIRQSKLINSVE